jgi:hypothetical protein
MDYFEQISRVHNRITKMVGFCEDDGLKHDLMHLKDELNYCPPEMIGRWAYKMNQVLVTHIGENPKPGWQTAVINAYIQ